LLIAGLEARRLSIGGRLSIHSGAVVIELKWRLGRPSHRLLAGVVSCALVCDLAFACTTKE
jgi:hypothetical protein